MKRLLLSATAGLLALGFGLDALAERDQIRAVGSSTVYPFATTAAEKFGKAGKFKTPVIESTGTGGGFKLFCAGVGEEHPDISDASRAIEPSEKELCAKNGVKDPLEVKIGYDGIVLINAKGSPQFKLTRKQIFQALAKQLPGKDGKLADNTNQKWSDISADLPATEIDVYGPPPTSGTRDSFVELVMQKGCEQVAEIATAIPDKDARKKACSQIREDGKYKEMGENDNLIIQKLGVNAGGLGILGYSYLEQNLDKVQASLIEGEAPTFETISSGKYPVSRPLFVYVKREHIGKMAGIKEFIQELTSDAAIGDDGYLVAQGLIPLKHEELKQVRDSIK